MFSANINDVRLISSRTFSSEENDMVKAILVKPLDGQPVGAEREFDKVDFDRLKDMGAVRAAPSAPSAPSAPAKDEKAAEPVQNKKAPAVANKAGV